MSRGSRDRGITGIVARPGRYASGMGLGIMLVDDFYPAFPGDVRNPSAFPFPIQYEVVGGVDIQDLVYAEDTSACLAPALRAAERLEQMGVRAIAAECGYFALFQREVAAHVSVPVFMSSLLQVPLARQVVGSGGQVGIVCARTESLTDAHLRGVGIEPGADLVYADATPDHPTHEFANLWVASVRPEPPAADYERAEAEMLDLCRHFVGTHPDIRALVFECTGFQPFARAVQRDLDLPVFSWSTLLEFAYSVVDHRDFYGNV